MEIINQQAVQPKGNWMQSAGGMVESLAPLLGAYMKSRASQVEVPDQIGPVSDAELGINPGSHTLPDVQGVPGLDTLMAQNGVESMVGDQFSVGTPPPDPLTGQAGSQFGSTAFGGQGFGQPQQPAFAQLLGGLGFGR
jgi:hypothetical protein